MLLKINFHYQHIRKMQYSRYFEKISIPNSNSAVAMHSFILEVKILTLVSLLLTFMI